MKQTTTSSYHSHHVTLSGVSAGERSSKVSPYQMLSSLLSALDNISFEPVLLSQYSELSSLETGDETRHCEEFQVGADEAMALLGVKRSRLTQLAGKEIPCLRVKKGRYIRPMFRLQDLQTYLSHVRTPSSRAKGRQVMEGAVAELKNQTQQLALLLERQNQSISQEFSQFYGKFEHKLTKRWDDLESVMRSSLQAFSAELALVAVKLAGLQDQGELYRREQRQLQESVRMELDSIARNLRACELSFHHLHQQMMEKWEANSRFFRSERIHAQLHRDQLAREIRHLHQSFEDMRAVLIDDLKQAWRLSYREHASLGYHQSYVQRWSLVRSAKMSKKKTDSPHRHKRSSLAYER